MKISVKLPVTVKVYNVGTIVMMGNATATSHIKHLDIRDNYVNEYVEGGRVKIVFAKSAENDCIILAKNLNGDLHESKKMIGEKLE